jgi:magnesium/cobalt transport protein CorA
MKSKLQKIILCLFLLCCIYNLWTLRPVQILYTYSDAGNSVFLVVDHLPWTDSDKINWYLKHQNEIKNQHPLPEGSWHTWYVIDIGWKVRLCLMDTQRALNFLVRKARLPGGQLEQAREILRDIESLLPHNESLFQKVNFLMQAAMGFINIEQNRIIKIFSVVSVVFLPPTLVASSYGMNFEFMPELKWSFGYPGAIIFMILAGLAPYLYFKRKNWL